MAKTELILTEAIEKAQANGWSTFDKYEWSIHEAGGYNGWVACVRDNAKNIKTHISVADIIFTHDFAKALWGNESEELTDWFDLGVTSATSLPMWQCQLMKMAISEDPFEYIGKHLS